MFDLVSFYETYCSTASHVSTAAPGSVRTALALVLGKCTLLENDQLMISRRMETALMRRINLCALFLNVSVIFRSLYAFKAIDNTERAIFFNPLRNKTHLQVCRRVFLSLGLFVSSLTKVVRNSSF